MKNEEREKQIRKYIAYDKKLNALDLVLWQTDEYFEMVNGRTEQEDNLLGFLEREIHDLQYTIECLKREFENNKWELQEHEGKEAE